MSKIAAFTDFRAPPGLGLEGTIYVDRPVGLAPPVAKPCALPTVELQGVCFHAVTETQVVGHILDRIAAGQGGWVITPNLDHLRRLAGDHKLRSLYSLASLVVADGLPLVWAARLKGTPLPERVAGSNLISSLSAAAASRQRSVYLLGGDPGTADEAAGIMTRRFPGLRIAGTDCPKLGFERDARQIERIIDRLCVAGPDIVYVGLGSPKQEWLIAQLRRYLPMAWWMGIGISFSFVAGRVHRAPLWMQRTGLEWLHRLMQEPRRLARRYLIDGLPFALSLLGGAIRQRVARRAYVR